MADQESSASLIRDYGGTILVAVVLALLIRFFLIEAYRIPSAAMHPSLEPGDTIFVSKWPFGLRIPGFDRSFTSAREPRRGEVVVFSMQDGSHRDYIKRVVGLDGDKIQMKDGHLIVNDIPAEIPGSAKSNCATEKTSDGYSYGVCYENPSVEDFGPAKVPPGSVFVVGDLRARTPRERGSDLPVRSWGVEPLQALRGSALWIWLSVEPSNSSAVFPNFRLDRMFRRVR